jgi:hypothetical protein
MRFGSLFRSSPAVTLEAARVAVMTATLVVRNSEDGQRVVCLAPCLAGSFVYDRQDARARIERNFPGLTVRQVNSVVSLLHGRVVALGAPPRRPARPSWTHGWRE